MESALRRLLRFLARPVPPGRVLRPACAAGVPPNSAEKEGWRLVFREEFDGPDLDPSKFSPLYLPHWTTAGQSLARYEEKDGILSLHIEKDQGPWWHGDSVQRVSSIQTGMRDGLHRFGRTCAITGHHRAVSCLVTRYGYFELRARVPAGGGLHSAWWMVGCEDAPEHSAEVDVFEICGPDCRGGKSRVRVSVHPWGDKALREQTLDYCPACGLSQGFHVYGLEWRPQGMKFYFDGRLAAQTRQSPSYPMITLLGLYENNAPLWSGSPEREGEYPKRFQLDYFRVYKTEEMLAWDAAGQRKAAPGEDLAPLAAAGAAQDWRPGRPPSLMLDGSLCSAMESALHPTFPQYLYLDWDSPQTFDTVVLTVRGGPSQAPTSWDLEVSGDGETGWAPAASSGAVQWQGGPGWEEHALHFPAVTGKALRLRVNSANLRHGRYAIHRLSVFLRR